MLEKIFSYLVQDFLVTVKLGYKGGSFTLKTSLSQVLRKLGSKKCDFSFMEHWPSGSIFNCGVCQSCTVSNVICIVVFIDTPVFSSTISHDIVDPLCIMHYEQTTMSVCACIFQNFSSGTVGEDLACVMHYEQTIRTAPVGFSFKAFPLALWVVRERYWCPMITMLEIGTRSGRFDQGRKSSTIQRILGGFRRLSRLLQGQQVLRPKGRTNAICGAI
ncbi:hypothetical protein HN873_029367, partial [Arachis hypogaea]